MNKLHSAIDLPEGLKKIANNRDRVPTADMAQAFSIANQTVRKNYSLKGECYGIKPIKVGNKLLWSVSDIALVLRG